MDKVNKNVARAMLQSQIIEAKSGICTRYCPAVKMGKEIAISDTFGSRISKEDIVKAMTE